MLVVGIDPGYGRCGVAVVKRHLGKDTLLHSMCIETPSTLEFSERLFMVGEIIDQIIVQYCPDSIALEEIYFSSNQKTAINIAEVRGMILYIARKNNIPVSEHNPVRIKIAMTGHGKASKDQVITMVERIIKPERPITYDDEYDAIAVALTHLAEYKNTKK
jgi:crossover junction endodeoxyribonuclease RuvC